MPIVEDASTPAPVDNTGAADLTTASFSPPAGSLLVAMVGSGWSNAPASEAVSVTDSSGGAAWAGTIQKYTGGNGFGGLCGIVYKYFSTAPGSITVTADFTSVEGPNSLVVKVLTGADAADPIGVTAGRQRGNGVDVDEAVTPEAAGSRIFVCAHFNDITASGNPTTHASTTTEHYVYVGDDLSSVWSMQSASDTADTGSVTYGGDIAEASPGGIVHLEVKEFQTVSGDLVASAPAAQVDIQAEETIGASLDTTAPLAQADVQTDVIVDASLTATAPVAQVDATGDVQVNILQPVAPLAQLSMAGEEEVIDGGLALAAPSATVSFTSQVTVAGTADPTAPGATFSSQSALRVAGALEPTAPLASLGLVGGYAGGQLAMTAPLASLLIGSETRIFGRRVIVVEQDFNNRVLEVPSDQPPETFYV